MMQSEAFTKEAPYTLALRYTLVNTVFLSGDTGRQLVALDFM